MDYLGSHIRPAAERYLTLYELLERYALFEDVFVPELRYLGTRVSSVMKQSEIVQDIDAILGKLHTVTERARQEEVDLVLERHYIRCAIGLVGRPEKLRDTIEPYVRYLQRLARSQIDSVYLLSDASKETAVDAIVRAVSDDYEQERRKRRRAALFGRLQDVVIIELRSKEASVLSSRAIFSGEAPGILGEQDPLLALDSRRADGGVYGTILFLTDEGWGFISLDDPSFSDNAWFSSTSLIRRPPVVGGGDRVVCKVIRDERGYRATDVRIILSGYVAAAESLSETALEAGTTAKPPGTADAGDRLPALNALGPTVIQLLHDTESAYHGIMGLASVGVELRERVPGFSHQAYGFVNLVSLMEEVADGTPEMAVGRYTNGHPYVALAAAHVEGPTDEASPSATVDGGELPGLSGLAQEIVNAVTANAERTGLPALTFASLGSEPRTRTEGFSHQAYGYRNLLGLVEAVADADDRIAIGRFENGHPYVTVRSLEHEEA